MKLRQVVLSSAVLMLAGCAAQQVSSPVPAAITEVKNSQEYQMLIQPSPAPFGIPQWDQYKIEYYKPAFTEAMARHEAEVAAIVDNTEEPTFANTVVALENSGRELERVASIFYNLLSMETNDDLQKLAQELSPALSAHEDAISLNEKLFARVKKVYEQIDTLNLDTADRKLLTDTYKGFVSGGAELAPEAKKRFTEINQRLSAATLEFGDHVLAEENKFVYLVTEEQDLSGLPKYVIDQAAATAQDKGLTGWAFTLKYPSIQPVLRFADSEKLRQAVYTAYVNKGNNNDELDNKNLAVEIANLRLERARLLGFKHHADYVLQDNMAKNAAGVFNMMGPIWEKSVAAANRELAKLTALKGSPVRPWDWAYYTEKLRQTELGINDEEVRPYFELDKVRAGAFALANRLYGITFNLRTDLPTYHKDALVYEVKEADGTTVGILSMDSFPRDSKRGGAWMNDVIMQETVDGKRVIPVIVNVHNFTPPSGDTPALLSLDEVETLFHELGHAIHGLLSNTKYRSQSGTNVPRDFVEMPSQLNENWVLEPELLAEYAHNYKDGSVIPEELVKKLRSAGTFNQGFVTTELMAASYLDMAWHTITEPFTGDPLEFEQHYLASINMPVEVGTRYRTTYFRHVFSGGYSAGYYSYLWTQVLDADVFSKFKAEGLFSRELGQALREKVFEKGGSAEAEDMYLDFMGRPADSKAFLERKGMND